MGALSPFRSYADPGASAELWQCRSSSWLFPQGLCALASDSGGCWSSRLMHSTSRGTEVQICNAAPAEFQQSQCFSSPPATKVQERVHYGLFQGRQHHTTAHKVCHPDSSAHTLSRCPEEPENTWVRSTVGNIQTTEYPVYFLNLFKLKSIQDNSTNIVLLTTVDFVQWDPSQSYYEWLLSVRNLQLHQVCSWTCDSPVLFQNVQFKIWLLMKSLQMQ